MHVFLGGKTSDNLSAKQSMWLDHLMSKCQRLLVVNWFWWWRGDESRELSLRKSYNIVLSS